MTTVRLFFKGERVGPKFERSARRQGNVVRASLRGTALDVAEQFLRRARADIRAGGNFGSARWIDGLKAQVTEGGGNIRVSFTHSVPYFMVFQKGAVIHGKPLLWIPLDFAKDAQGIRARDFPGQLFRVDRKSGKAPLLLAAKDKQPKYFGKESVTIPKKFHVIEIARELGNQMQQIYNARLKIAVKQAG